MDNPVDIYINRKKWITQVFVMSIPVLMILGMTLFFVGLMVLSFTKTQNLKPLILLAPIIMLGFAGYIVAIRLVALIYPLFNKGPYLRIDHTGITRLAGPHTLHIAWNNIAYIGLGAYAGGRYNVYLNIIIIHILDTTLLDQKAYFWANPGPFRLFGGIGINNCISMPINKLFVLLKEYQSR